MKILAIDIGTAHIKSVIVEAKFKRFDIVLHDVTSVPDAWDPIDPRAQLLSPGQLSTLAEIRQRYGEGVDRVVTNLPFSLYSSRFQTFPLKDKRKLLAAVQFAIEDEIPFDTDQCIVTSHLYPTKTKETSVLTGFAQISSLQSFLDAIATVGISPDCLMMEDAALSAQFLRAKAEVPKAAAVLNLGHRKSGMYFFRHGLPVLHRNCMVGGFQLTEAIAARYSLGMAEAELAKIDRGFLVNPGMQVNPDQMVLSETLRGALEPVFADFQQSMLAFTSRYPEPLEVIYLAGGTALLPGLPEYLAARWEKKVRPLEVTKLYPDFSIQPQKSVEWLLPNATSLGLSQVAGDQRSRINFRSGKLHSASRGLNLNFQQFIYPAKLALSLYLVAILSVIGQTFLLQRQLATRSAQLDRALQNVIGRVSNSYLANLKSSPTRLRDTVEKKVEEYRAQVKGSGSAGPSAIDFLQALSHGVPKSVTTEIRSLNYQPKSVNLVMESPSQTTAERAASTLASLPLFTNAKAGAIENAKGTRKKFSFNANLKGR